MLVHDTIPDISLPDVKPRPFVPKPQAFLKGMAKLPGVLKILGYEKLRPGQDAAVYNLFHHRDTYTVLPTSHGKTAISVVPALCMDWKCLIFSPLVALMQDQVTNMQRLGLSAGAISSGQTATENLMTLKSWEIGELQFLLVAPERLENDEFLRVIKLARPNLISLDEAHCLSVWSSSFRPSYAKIGNLISAVNPDAVLAMTATSTPEIETDVRRVLGISGAARVFYMPPRTELVLKSEQYRNVDQVWRYVENAGGPTIVYCATRDRCEELFAAIGTSITGGSLVYHGGMTPDARASNQNLFMSDDVRVMFATNAFGMGIDKRNIRMILHRDIPSSIEAYAQEAGRAARDGKPSLCVALQHPDAYNTSQYFLESSYPDRITVEKVYTALRKMADKDNKIMKTGEDIARHLGLKSQPVSAALGVLKSSGVVDRTEAEEKTCCVRFLKEPVEPRFVALLKDVKEYGMALPDGSVDISIDLLVTATQRKASTLTGHLRQLDKMGCIVYTLPFRGKTTIIKGDISLVDFERLAKQKDYAYDKLAAMYRLLDTPDAQKHEFMTNYFGA